jgi:hypothetical protein
VKPRGINRPRPVAKVSIGFIHPGHYSACFAESLSDLLLFDLSGPQRTAHDHGKIGKECGSGGIVDGRNLLAKTMLDESAADWLFMVDSDMGFAPDILERLIDAADPDTRPVVGGLAFAHKTDGRGEFFGIRYRAQPTLYTFVETADKVGVVPTFDYPRDELVAVDATGGACVLVHRSVFVEVRDRYGDVWFDPVTVPKGPTKFSEDLSFFLRLGFCRIPVHVHTGIKTTHDKGGVFLDEEFYDRQQAAKEMQCQPLPT